MCLDKHVLDGILSVYKVLNLHYTICNVTNDGNGLISLA